MRRSPLEAGSATVLVVAMAGVLMFVLVALSSVSGLVTAQRTAQAAADLAALAGAATAMGGGDPCGQAALIASANSAGLEACSEVAGVVVVKVTVPGPRWTGRSVRVGAEARAGPGQPQAVSVSSWRRSASTRSSLLLR